MAILDKREPRGTWPSETRWTLVMSLDRAPDDAWQSSWNELATAYRRPMEVYARRRLARFPGGAVNGQDAPDVVQSFLAQCVEKDWLSRADRNRGKFRAFVQDLLRKHVTAHMRRKLAKKREGGASQKVVSLLPTDVDHAAVAADPTDAAAFDRTWTEVAVTEAIARLREHNERDYLVIKDLMDTDGEGSEDLPTRMGLVPKQFAVVKHRARKRFARRFEDELRATVGDPAAFAEEWRALAPYMP